MKLIVAKRIIGTWVMGAMATQCYAFDPKNQGFSAQTEIAPNASFVVIEKTVRYTVNATGALTQNINFLGMEWRQSLQYKYLTFEAASAGAISVGAVNMGASGDTWPARDFSFDASGTLYFSIPLLDEQTLYLEPAFGFGFTKVHVKSMNINNIMYNLADLLAYGPTGGIYLRMFPLPVLSFRIGAAYQMTRTRHKAFNFDGTPDPDSNPFVNVFEGSYSLRARRHGLFALARFDYTMSERISFMMSAEIQSWGSSGTAIWAGDANGHQDAFLMSRTRLVWGVNVNY